MDNEEFLIYRNRLLDLMLKGSTTQVEEYLKSFNHMMEHDWNSKGRASAWEEIYDYQKTSDTRLVVYVEVLPKSGRFYSKKAYFFHKRYNTFWEIEHVSEETPKEVAKRFERVC